MKITNIIFAAAGGAAALALGGCASTGGLPPASNSTASVTPTYGVVVVANYHDEPLARLEHDYQVAWGRTWPAGSVPVDLYTGYSRWHGNWPRFVVPAPADVHLQVGDYVEFEKPAHGKIGRFIQVETRWNDPSPTGCVPLAGYSLASHYWSGGIECSGRLVTDGAARRAEMRETMLYVQKFPWGR